MSTTIIGIDPGIVTTGVVSFTFTDDHEVEVQAYAFESGALTEDGKPDYEARRAEVTAGVKRWVGSYPDAVVFMEAYRPRGQTYGTDEPMRDLMSKLRHAVPKAKVIDNTGVKQVIKQQLMEALGVWKFQAKTHHQDLRSAARIGLYGAVKDDALNEIVFEAVMKKLYPGTPPASGSI